ncbi:MAG: PQQ-binding-like beta-propeller repeat protein [Actinobacteria bacterium]|nr:PQQ-binding-like beta-propeller repeat protein [Actinomycetota bacterium]
MRGRGVLQAVMAVAVVALIVASLFLVRRSGERITPGESDWAMPGGNPSHTSFLSFAPRDNLRELWGTRLESEPVGPPAVVGGRVYVCCRNGFLYCLELESGRPLWRYEAGSGFTSMPAVSEEGIIAGTVDGRVLCVGAGGKLAWKVEVGGAVPATPVPQGGRVFFGSMDGSLYCVDAGNGKRRWTFQADTPIAMSPCVYEGQVFAVTEEGDLLALDERNGRLVWTYRCEEMPASFPVADEGRVYQATETTLHCAEAQSGKRLWSRFIGSRIVSNPALRGNQVQVVQGWEDSPSTAIALDARTGDPLWSVASGETSGWTWLFATTRDVYLAGPGQLRAVLAESGTPTMRWDGEGILPETLTVSRDRILVATDSRKVFCLGE